MSTTDRTARYARIRAQFAEEGAKLESHEARWSEKQSFLASRGYVLRPRYHPGWRPSWEKNPDVDPRDCEDFWRLPVSCASIVPHLLTDRFPVGPQYFPNIIDATRATDGRLVCLKRVASSGQELQIGMYFSNSPIRDDSHNHCIPIIDSFPDDEHEEISYIVMPFLRTMDDPPFDIVNDILNFADQVLEVSVMVESMA